MRRGEVRWYRFSTPHKRRPVLILTRNSVLEFLGEVTVAPVTSTIREIPSEVRLTQADGMPRECAVNLDHVQTVTRARVGPVIATVSPGKMSEVRTALLFALGFEYLTIPATVQAILAARIDRLGPRPSGRL